ncbi:hypothetical protein CFOLD11_26330 [Clostridium folliculivorans]|uniref:Uncharacterized protein n=1 Tax=Clostridium folliculivorans TaxID=2886038 RepID=A0A9W5Y3C6_9CLOT|nr:hypothetical protein CFOLD11_26330 [Clostridium folliculivorans]
MNNYRYFKFNVREFANLREIQKLMKKIFNMPVIKVPPKNIIKI